MAAKKDKELAVEGTENATVKRRAKASEKEVKTGTPEKVAAKKNTATKVVVKNENTKATPKKTVTAKVSSKDDNKSVVEEIKSIKKVAKATAVSVKAKSKEAVKPTAKKAAGKTVAKKTAVAKTAAKKTLTSKKKTVSVKKPSGKVMEDELAQKLEESLIPDESKIAVPNPVDVWQHYHQAPQAEPPGLPPPPEPPQLPDYYGDEKVILLARDPEWLYCYWDCSQQTRELLRGDRLHHEGKRLVLRILCMDAPEPGQMQGNTRYWFDVAVLDFARDWYIRVPEDGCIWRAELAVVSSNSYETILASNLISMPRSEMSENDLTNWMTVDEETFMALAESISIVPRRAHLHMHYEPMEFPVYTEKRVGNSKSGSILQASRPDAIRVMRGSEELLFRIKKSIERLGLDKHISSISIAQVAAAAESAAKIEVDMPLEVRYELHVYGKTNPTCVLSVNGKQHNLTSNGEFTAKYPLSADELKLNIVSEDLQNGLAKAIDAAIKLTETKRG